MDRGSSVRLLLASRTLKVLCHQPSVSAGNLSPNFLIASHGKAIAASCITPWGRRTTTSNRYFKKPVADMLFCFSFAGYTSAT